MRAWWIVAFIIILLSISCLGPINWRIEGTWYDGLRLWEYEIRAVVMPVEMATPIIDGGLPMPTEEP